MGYLKYQYKQEEAPSETENKSFTTVKLLDDRYIHFIFLHNTIVQFIAS